MASTNVIRGNDVTVGRLSQVGRVSSGKTTVHQNQLRHPSQKRA